MKHLKINKSVLSTLIMLFLSIAMQAQSSSNEPDMADIMRSNGKIYVVVAVLTVIFLGIVVFLISLDRKLNKLEKLIQDKK